VKSVPHVPISHPFVERMIRATREELPDPIRFWNPLDLERKLAAFRIHYNRHRVHSGIDGIPPEQTQGRGQHTTLPLTEFRWMSVLRNYLDRTDFRFSMADQAATGAK
jgi:hypothetical protein